MKKSLFFSSVALCALTIVGCNKEVDSPEVTPKGREIHFTINAGAPETKTFIEYDNVNHKYVPKWQNSDKLGVIFNAFGESKKAADAEFTNTLADGATASFSGTGTVDANEQTLYAFYPASAFGKAYSGSVIGLTIPDIQKPTSTSFDPDADILVNEPYAMTIDNAEVVISDMKFRRVGSLLKLVITDETATGKISSDKIKTATISSNMANAAFAGRYRYDFVSEKAYYNSGAVNEHMATKIASVTADLTDNLLSVGDPIFLVVNPQDLAADSKLTVQIATDNHNITKEITLTQVLPFRGGTMTSITVGIKDEDEVTEALESKTFVLVKDAAELTVGSEVIIADFGDDNAVMSTTQNSNNRSAVTVEKSNDKQSITTDNVAVQVFTIAAGSVDNTIAFYDGAGYIYAANSSSNYMKTEEDLSDNSSWAVTIDSGTGEATLLAQGNYTRNKMRFNPNNGNPIFSCYASSSTTGSAVSIYKLEDNRTPSGLAWDDDQGLGDFNDLANTILPDLVNPNNVSPITYSSSDPTVATVLENEHTVTLLKAGTTQIHARFAGDATYKPADVYYTLTVEDSRIAVTLAFATPSYALVMGSDDYNAFTGQTATATPSVTGIVYEISGAAIGTVNATTGVVTLDGATLGTATVTASFAGNATYKASEPASYTITVGDGSAPKGTTAENPYTASEAIAAADALNGSTKENVYVKGIISKIVTAYNDQYHNVTFNISEDGLTTNEFQMYRAAATSASDFSVGDFVLMKGTLKKYNSTQELDAGATVVSQIHAPAFTPDGGSFVGSQNVEISADGGAEIRYTLDGTTPTSSTGSVYSSAIAVSETTTIKAIAVKDGEVTGVVSKTFTKVSMYVLTFGNPTNGSITVKHGETTLVSGAQIANGETITITVEPDSGYQLATLVYNDGSDHDIKSTKSFTMPSHDVVINATFEVSQGGAPVVDVLNREFTGVSGTSYSTWSSKTGTSGAVYAGQSAGGNSSIQLRTTNNNSGVITTASGGKVKKITVTWNSNTTSGRTLNVYGKNSAYTAATDLYNNSNQGTLLGTIVYGTSTELTITDDYEFIGFRSNSGALYLTSVEITWEQ